MQNRNYFKIVWAFAFVAFAAVSCWATAESLHLLFDTWPIIMCYVVTVGFFIIAAYGTKMIVDSLNQENNLGDKATRSWYLVGGIIIVVIFWLICSMPTNTHTFFYRNKINEIAGNDIKTTQSYLQQIKNNTKNVDFAKLKIEDLKSKVDAKLLELKTEIYNELNPGFGERSRQILTSIEEILGIGRIDPLSYRGTSEKERKKLYELYRDRIYLQYEDQAKKILDNIQRPKPEVQKEVNDFDKKLSAYKVAIDNFKRHDPNLPTIDLNNSNDVADVCNLLNDSYTTICNNKDFVTFNSEEDKSRYTPSDGAPVTKVKQLTSVYDVWMDFLKGNGESKDRGFFTFWIIISILVDVAAFIFFDLAFKK